MKRLILPLIVFVAVVAVLGVGLTLEPDRVPSPLIDRPAPAFTAEELDDAKSTVSLEAIKGQVAVVNVWASWCVACAEEHPYIMALAERVPVYGLNYKDERAAAQSWLARHGNAYTAIAYDPKGAIGLDWGVYGVPETYLLDAEGTIRYKHIGVITERDLEQELLPRLRRLRGQKSS